MYYILFHIKSCNIFTGFGGCIHVCMCSMRMQVYIHIYVRLSDIHIWVNMAIWRGKEQFNIFAYVCVWMYGAGKHGGLQQPNPHTINIFVDKNNIYIHTCFEFIRVRGNISTTLHICVYVCVCKICFLLCGILL